MTHTTRPARSIPSATTDHGARAAFLILRGAFALAPVLFGLDKFFGVLTDWDRYLAPWINDIVPGSAHQAMIAVGVVEIVAGVLVALRPTVGGYVVAAWLLGIVVNLVTMGQYYDIALRDVGLMLGALALARLSTCPATRAEASAR
ncbi:MAG TPA: hypothetical protein VFR87_13180 [Nocardioidaceae bacterium]|nr:hypothetical protein [Nocardioidaceae bacterium]